MELEKLKYFRTIFETSSLKEAAILLNISPGALSKSMKSLAFELDVTLFLNVGKRIIPTDKARRLYNSSSVMINEYDHIRANLALEEAPLKNLCIGSFEIFTTYFMSTFIKNELPIDQGLKVLEFSPGRIEEALRNNTIDIGITTSHYPHPDIQAKKVGSIRFKIFGHPHFRNDNISDLPFAIPSSPVESNASGILTLDGWRFGPRKIKYRFELLQTALEAASQGLCVLYCPEFIVNLFNIGHKKNHQLIEIPHVAVKPNQSQQDIFLLTSKFKDHNEIVKKLNQSLKKICS